MYLSRLILNPRSRQVRSELADVYEMHRTVMKAFAGRLETDERALFRVDIHPRTGIPTLLVQSVHQPDWGFLTVLGKDYLLSADDLPLDVENPAVKPVEVVLNPGQTLAFRLRANPTVKKDREGQKQGRRVGLVREDDQLKWLQRKIEAAGANLISANIANDAHVGGKLFREKEKHTLSFIAVQFDGILQVNDPDLLVKTIGAGIGSGKGLGFGLLSLAPARG
jgi:CRISPR system Cascade subunit CasE